MLSSSSAWLSPWHALQVLAFVLNAVKAEAFNEKKTLFLFGSYTIGKEKLFLEVARSLKQKVTNIPPLVNNFLPV